MEFRLAWRAQALYCALVLSIFLTAVGAFARPDLSRVPKEMRGLPEGVITWWVFETDYMSREADPLAINDLEQTTQAEKFRPEARRVFDVTGYWLPAEDLEVFRSRVPKELASLVLREKNGHAEVLFFIHPESLDLYPEITRNRRIEKVAFKAVPTASSRGLLVWRPGAEKYPFVAKVSLNREIAESIRIIKGVETHFSVEVSKVLNRTGLPDGMGFMDEVLGLIPKGMTDGGAIYRTLPGEMLANKLLFAPLFSLYGGSDKVPQGTLLKRLIDRSGKEPVDFVRTEIIRPFVKVWLDLALQGVTLEAHAQNVLVAMTNDDRIERFEARDFGGFDFDKVFRARFGRPNPAEPPGSNLQDVPGAERFGVEHGNFLFKSLQRYFAGGFLYNIEALFRQWRREKVYPIPQLLSGWTKEMLAEELSLELTARLGKKVRVRSDLRDLSQKIRGARETLSSTSRATCRQLLSSVK